eukprot:12769991-Alexandrium_andersonii.AAC.1
MPRPRSSSPRAPPPGRPWGTSGVLQDTSGFLAYCFDRLLPDDLRRFQAQAGGPKHVAGGSGRAGQPPGLEDALRSQYISFSEFRQSRSPGCVATTLTTIRGTQLYCPGRRTG